jgi:ketosteroid isomerase-like protein
MKDTVIDRVEPGEPVTQGDMSRRNMVRGALVAMVGLPAAAAIGAHSANAAEGASKGDPKAEIEAIEQELMKLYSNGLRNNYKKIMEYFDDGPEMLQYDIMSPREYRGPAFQKHFMDLVKEFESNIKVEITDMHIWAHQDMAFAASIQRNYGTDPKGKPFDFTMRVTDCFYKVKGKWKIVHEHVSFPIDSMASGKVDYQSKP